MKELQRFLQYLKGYEGQIGLAITLILAGAALSLPYPMIVREIVNFPQCFRKVTGMFPRFRAA